MTTVEIDPGELAANGSLVTGPTRPDRRHPVELTVGRIHDHVDTYGRHLTPADMDVLAEAVEVLDILRARLDGVERRRARAAE